MRNLSGNGTAFAQPVPGKEQEEEPVPLLSTSEGWDLRQLRGRANRGREGEMRSLQDPGKRTTPVEVRRKTGVVRSLKTEYSYHTGKEGETDMT
jgi:hypothetical protein